MTLRQTRCSSCGASVGKDLEYCIECGTRVARQSRVSLKVFAWGSTVGALVVGLALLLSASSDNPAPDERLVDESAASPQTSPAATTAAAELRTGPIRASRVTCSSELPDYPCAALIDRDPTTAWNEPRGGEGAKITVFFDGTVRVTAVTFENLADDEGLMRNGRARMVEIHLTDSAALTTVELESGHGPYRVVTVPDPTTSLEIHILTTYPGEHYEGHDPFEELALQELTFAGITSAP